MYRQTGPDLVFDSDGLLKRGLVIRLLVLPNDVACVEESIEWIRDELNPKVAISLMAQYYPTHQAESNNRYVLLSRRIRESEWMKATSALEQLAMEEGWVQEFDGAAYYYRPDFFDQERPFRDIRDFE
jgi:putative pyruvate formate lyase activating enzyme